MNVLVVVHLFNGLIGLFIQIFIANLFELAMTWEGRYKFGK